MKKNKLRKIAMAVSTCLLAGVGQGSLAAPEVEETLVTGLRDRLAGAGRLQDVIQKTEVLDSTLIDARQALNLSQAIQHQPGVRVSNECSMCGAKRVMLNGMRGEHTTILVDGLPVHTMISGFYALDALATTGIDRIEIARGAGASLIAPEAIGGTVNVVTRDAQTNYLEADISAGQHGYQALQAYATGVSSDRRTGLTLIAQYDTHDQTDGDNNGVSEKPFQENSSLSARLSHDINDHNNIQVRLARVNSEVFGGPVLGDVVHSIGSALASYDGVESEQLFEGGNVNNRFVGKPWETLEWVDTTREEAYVKWLTEFSGTLSAEFAWSYADHTQDSFYEGIDYFAGNTMNYYRGAFDLLWHPQHLLTFGVDHRTETLRSKTEALKDVESFISDSFDYDTYGFFLQNTWTPTLPMEISAVLRVDRVKADFIDPAKPGVEIEQTFIAPRLDARFFHTPAVTSRLSVGKGYRAPLSFFESEHGILDAEMGYLIDVDKLEESLSTNYALSYEGEKLDATFSLAYTRLNNLASLEHTEEGVPILSQLSEKASVTTADLVLGYQLTDSWNVRFSFENFDYDDAFKASYAIAPIEQRVTLGTEFEWHKFSLNMDAVWYASRDLGEYGYEGFDDDAELIAKPLTAPSYALVNFKAAWQFSEGFGVYAGANNLFNYSQVRKSGSPLMYLGGYDVAYIYGPMDSREFYAGVKWSF
jgi:outer membrane receptor for ferrienterochelin and colicins